mmetsp:Transcript_24407/g.44134  ORF Transcript_24407/g.44134 Transcript_24407/m.44134 type:complete len:665 (-) Transcript_24407:2330-4324(-)
MHVEGGWELVPCRYDLGRPHLSGGDVPGIILIQRLKHAFCHTPLQSIFETLVDELLLCPAPIEAVDALRLRSGGHVLDFKKLLRAKVAMVVGVQGGEQLLRLLVGHAVPLALVQEGLPAQGRRRCGRSDVGGPAGAEAGVPCQAQGVGLDQALHQPLRLRPVHVLPVHQELDHVLRSESPRGRLLLVGLPRLLQVRLQPPPGRLALLHDLRELLRQLALLPRPFLELLLVLLEPVLQALVGHLQLRDLGPGQIYLPTGIPQVLHRLPPTELRLKRCKLHILKLLQVLQAAVEDFLKISHLALKTAPQIQLLAGVHLNPGLQVHHVGLGLLQLGLVGVLHLVLLLLQGLAQLRLVPGELLRQGVPHVGQLLLQLPPLPLEHHLELLLLLLQLFGGVHPGLDHLALRFVQLVLQLLLLPLPVPVFLLMFGFAQLPLRLHLADRYRALLERLLLVPLQLGLGLLQLPPQASDEGVAAGLGHLQLPFPVLACGLILFSVGCGGGFNLFKGLLLHTLQCLCMDSCRFLQLLFELTLQGILLSSELLADLGLTLLLLVRPFRLQLAHLGAVLQLHVLEGLFGPTPYCCKLINEFCTGCRHLLLTFLHLLLQLLAVHFRVLQSLLQTLNLVSELPYLLLQCCLVFGHIVHEVLVLLHPFRHCGSQLLHRIH